MSASVFKPISLDIPKMRSPLIDRKLLSKGIGVTRVRRALFEPVDHVETQKFLEKELAKHSVRQSKKWDFNFANEIPAINPRRYEWIAVVQTTEIKEEKYKKRALEVEDETANLYPQFDEIDQDIAEFGDRLPECRQTEELLSTPLKKQRLITDFMLLRKHATTKKSAPRVPSSLVPPQGNTAAS